MSGQADIGIRVFLDDAASSALFAINSALGKMAMGARTAGTAMGGLSASMMGLAVLAGFALALLGFGAALKYSVDVATAFQQSMFAVAVATHVPMDVAMQYASQLMTLAATSTYSSQEIANGIVIMGRSGYDIKSIFNGMAQAGIALGIAIRTDAVSGFTLLSQTMAAYKAPASEAIHYADLLQFAFEHQTGSVSQLQSALAQVTPVAAMLGTPLRELVSALDVVGPAMGSTNKAGTALRYALAGIVQPTALAITAMASLGLITVSDTTPAFQKFASQLLATGAVSQQFVKDNSNSVAGLQNLFKAAQQAGIVPLDAKFNEWAIGSGMLKNAFFDASGKAKDLTQILQILNDKLKGMPDAQKLAYLKDIFSVRGGQGMDVLLTSLSKYKQYLDQLAKSHDNAGGAMARWGQAMQTLGGAVAGFKSSLQDLGVVIGLALIGPLTKLATQANQVVTAIRSSAMANPAAAASFLKLGAAMSIIGIIATVVILLIAGIGTGLAIFVGIVLGVAAGVVLLTVGIMLVVNWFRQLYASSALVRTVIGALGAVFNEIGAQIRSGLAAAIAFLRPQLQSMVQALSEAGNAMKPLLPILGAVAAVIMGVVIGAIRGLVLALITFVTGLALVVIGLVHMASGIIQVFMGIFTVIRGILSLNGPMIVQGFSMIGTGILRILQGALQIIQGLFIAIFGTIIAFIIGFVQGVISWFTHLASILVGGSIIPVMLQAILRIFITVLTAVVSFVVSFVSQVISYFVNLAALVISIMTAAWNMFRMIVTVALAAIVAIVSSGFQNIVSRVVSAGVNILNAIQNAWNSAKTATLNAISAILSVVGSLPGKIIAALSGLAGMMYNSAMNAIGQFAAGIRNGVGGVISAVGGLLSQVSGMLHHSTPKIGPLAGDDQWMPEMMKMFAYGIESHAPLLQNAMGRAVGGMASVPQMARMGTPTSPTINLGGGGGNQVIQLVVDGRVLTQVVMNNLTGQMSLNGLGRAFR